MSRAIQSGRWAVAAVCLLAAAGLLAQSTSLGKVLNVKVPDYYSTGRGAKTNALRSLLSGAEASPRGLSLQVDIRGLKIEHYRPDGRLEAVIRSPACVFDAVAHIAWSAGPLELATGDGLSTIRGEGFLWQQTNGVLIISNQTETVLHRPQDKAAAALSPAAAAAAASNDTVRILASRCVVLSQSNRVVYSGDVQADNPRLQLRCQWMQIRLDENRRLQDCLARDQVVVFNPQDQSRTTCGAAAYTVLDGEDLITLDDHPLWRSRQGDQELAADRFVIRPDTRQLRAAGHALMKLPRGSLDLSAAPWARPAAAVPAGKLAAPVEVSADLITLQMPAINQAGPVSRSILAETNVVILSPADQSRATADRAAVAEAEGRLVLSGNAVWSSERMTVKAATLSVDRATRVFSARGRARLEAPVQSLGAYGSTGRRPAGPPGSNPVLIAESDTLEYHTNRIVLNGTAHVLLQEKEVLLGTLDCAGLVIDHAQGRVERLEARGGVLADQPPALQPNGVTMSRWLACETLQAFFDAEGRIRELIVDDQVAARFTEARPAWAAPRVTDLTCDTATARFEPGGRLLQRLVAQRKVVITQGDKSGSGGRAVYDPAAQMLELTDHPRGRAPFGALSEADTILYDIRRERFTVRGLIQMEGQLPQKTNSPAIPRSRNASP